MAIIDTSNSEEYARYLQDIAAVTETSCQRMHGNMPILISKRKAYSQYSRAMIEHWVSTGKISERAIQLDSNVVRGFDTLELLICYRTESIQKI